MTGPRRGDLVAGVTVALALVPQSIAYTGLAGLPPEAGLYAAAAAPLPTAPVGLSPYLQTGPVTLTSLLVLEPSYASSSGSPDRRRGLPDEPARRGRFHAGRSPSPSSWLPR